MSGNNRALAGVIAGAVALSLAWGVSASADDSSDRAAVGTVADRASAGKPALNRSERKLVKKLAKRMARRQIRKQAPKLRVASAATADNAVNAINATNAVHAAAADMATNAQNAANAAKVGGLDVKKFSVVVPSGGAPAQIASHQGFTVTASCAAGAPELRAAAAPTGGRLRSARIDNNEVVLTTGTSNLGSLGMIGGGSPLGSLTAEYVSPSGQVVNLWVGYRDDGPGCAFFGNYMFG